MLYEAYEKKIMRIAHVRDEIVKRRFLILGIFAFLLLLLAAFLFSRGIITENVTCPERVTYGNELECSAAALFGDIDYEYSADGEVWTGECPKMPGSYFVRAVSRRAFGIKNHGEAKAFVIDKRATELTVAPSAHYGDIPDVFASDLAGGDAIAAAEVVLDAPRADISAAEITEGSVIITDADGRDVTAAYELTLISRAVTVTARPVTVTTDSREREYDGTPLTADGYSITSGSLAFDDGLTVDITGSITDAGSATNAASVSITSDGEDMTHKYAVTLNAGALTVNKRGVTVKTASYEKTYDGYPLVRDSYEITAGTIVAGQTLASDSWAQIDEAGETPNTAVWQVFDGGRDVTYNYDITENAGTLTVHKRDITLLSGSADKVYNGTPLTCTDYAVTVGSLADNQRIEVVNASEITDVGEIPNTLEYKIYYYGSDVTKNYNITANEGALKITKRAITLLSDSDTKTYDGAPLYCLDNTVVSGSMPMGHYTEVTLQTEITDVSTAENRLSYIIRNGNGRDVTENFDITSEYGTLTVTPRLISVTVVYAEKIYDGTPLTSNAVTADNLVDGHTATAETNGSQTNVGSSLNAIGDISTVRISDALGNDVTRNYTVSTTSGELVVIAREITVTAGSATEVYDGTPLTCADYSAENLVNGHTVTAETRGSQTDAGSSNNVIVDGSVTVFDGNGNNVTRNYNIYSINGVLNVTPRPITVTSGDEEKIYDGYPLTCAEAELTGGSLVGNHYIECASISSITDAGSTPNNLAYNVLDGETGRDVTGNYEITEIAGTLTVHKRDITLLSGSADKVYNGTPLTCTDYAVTVGSLADNQRIEVVNASEITDVGEIPNTLEYKIYYYGTDVTKNYNITANEGALKITKRAITLLSGSDTKTYDGAPLYCLDNTVVSGSMPTGHFAAITQYARITDVGTIPNTVSYIIRDVNLRDVTENFDIATTYGTLTVTPRLISVTVVYAEKIYDGTPLTSNAVTADNLVDGHTATAETNGSQTNVGSSLNAIGDISTVRISDALGNDVTRNYEVVALYSGILQVFARDILVTAGSATNVYDGTPLTCADYKVDNLVDGHTATAETRGSQTDAGLGNNIIVDGSVTVFDGNGNNVTRNYNIYSINGVLNVTPRPITVTSGSAEKIYDGYPLTCAEAELTGGSLVGNHYIECASISSITDAGSTPNNLAYNVLDGETGRDVTHNYDITENAGTLTVTPRPLTIESGSATKEYDDIELYCVEYSFPNPNAQPLVGHYVDLSGSSRIQYVGKANNEQVYFIYDNNGDRGVTDNYAINYVYGTLEITPRALVVRADSAKKQYDGTPLMCATVSADRLIPGHSISAETVGSQTEIGVSPNVISSMDSVVIKSHNGFGEDVTYNYAISLETGTLTVVEYLGEKDETEGGGGEASGIDRTGNISTDGDGMGGNTVFLYVYGENSETVYLRDLSYGNYTKYGWTQGVAYGGAFNPLYSIGSNLSNYGYSSTSIKIQSRVDGLPTFMPYYALDGGVTGNDVYVGGTVAADTIYSFDYIPYYLLDYVLRDGLIYNYTDEELAYRSFVQSQYLTVPASTRRVMYNLASENGLLYGADVFDTVELVRQYIMTAATYDMNFQIPEDTDDVIVYFLTEGKRGVCQHFAAAATLMLRTLGIPARYTTGFLASTQSGAWSPVSGAELHAWVEVYIDGVGWVQLETTPSGSSEESDEIIIMPENIDVVYNGKEHTAYDNGEPKVRLLRGDVESTFGKNARFEYIVTGSRTEIGVGTLKIENFKVFDATGRDVTANYEIRFITGMLSVNPVPIKVVPYEMSKEYDGTPLVCGASSYSYDGELLEGHSLLAEAGGEMVDAGSTPSYIVWAKVVDSAGSDVSEYYNIMYETTMMTIQPRSIMIASDSADKVYDGSALTSQGYRVSVGSLVDGHRITSYSANRVGQTTVGSSFNDISNVRISDSYGNDVTGNYDIKYNLGMLTVAARDLTVTTASATKLYDGKPLTADGYSITGGSLASNHRLVVDTTGEQTERGYSENTATVRIIDSAGNDVTANYNLSVIHGILEVTGASRELTVTTASATKRYDGTPLTADGYSITSGSLANNHRLVVNTTGTRTARGSTYNTATVRIIDSAGNDVTANYKITVIRGILEVT